MTLACGWCTYCNHAKYQLLLLRMHLEGREKLGRTEHSDTNAKHHRRIRSFQVNWAS